jgi:hypothetical protein
MAYSFATIDPFENNPPSNQLKYQTVTVTLSQTETWKNNILLDNR